MQPNLSDPSQPVNLPDTPSENTTSNPFQIPKIPENDQNSQASTSSNSGIEDNLSSEIQVSQNKNLWEDGTMTDSAIGLEQVQAPSPENSSEEISSKFKDAL